MGVSYVRVRACAGGGKPISDDITDAHQRAIQALRFLTDVSEVLSTDSDVFHQVQRIAELAVPTYFGGLYIEARRLNGMADLVVQTGRPLGPDAFERPVQAHGRVLGTLRVEFATERTADEIDHALAIDLAKRLAIAFEAAELYAREHRVAETLQRALLPERLPQGPEIRHSAAYRPGADEAIVGGDWYDAFELPDGRTAFSIGDVAGHGLQAAVVMGEVRQAFRAAAINPISASLVLERANASVNMRSDATLVTAIFGFVEGSTVSYAVAGHPPPILAMPCGFVRALPASGIPLGVAASVGSRDWTFTLPPGSLLALYTDGLIEHSRDVAAGERELLDVVRGEIREPHDNPAQSILDRITAAHTIVDDAAALVLSTADRGTGDLWLALSAVPTAVGITRRALSRYATTHGVAGAALFSLLTAVGEASANAVQHAYAGDPGIVRINARIEANEFIVTVQDDGHWKAAERRDDRGRGLPIIRALMDRFEVAAYQNETRLLMALRLDKPVREPA